MPNIPIFDNTVSTPLVPPLPTASPGAFEAPAQALQQTGGKVQEAGTDWGTIYANAKRQQTATTLTSQGMSALADAQFKWSHTDDSDAALEGYRADAAAITKQTLAQTSDPEVASYVQRSLTTQGIIGAENTRDAAFNLQASKYRGQLDTTLANYAQQAALAAGPGADAQRAHLTDLANQAITGAQQAHWLAPQEASDRTISFTSQIQEVKARLLMAGNPVAAAAILQDPKQAATEFPGLLPEKAAAMAGEATMRAWRVEGRAANAQAHVDAVARLEFERTQQRNEIGVLTDIYAGRQPDMDRVASMANNLLISPSGLEAIENAHIRGLHGVDDTPTVLQLYQHLGQGTLEPDDIYAAANAGMKGGKGIGGTTALDLMKALNEAGNVTNKAAAQSGLATLKTMFGGAAIENGTATWLKDEGQRASAQATWGAVQAEFYRRVQVGKEDPNAVVPDLLTRFQQIPDGVAAGLKFGPVSTQADLERAQAALVAAGRARTIDRQTYEEQALILNRLGALLAARGGAPLPLAAATSGARTVAPVPATPAIPAPQQRSGLDAAMQPYTTAPAMQPVP